MLQELKRAIFVGTISDILLFMRDHGTSVLVNWGEDDNLWECSWITGGERFTEVSGDLERSVRRCAAKVVNTMERARAAPGYMAINGEGEPTPDASDDEDDG